MASELLSGSICGKIWKCAMRNYTSKHNVPRQICPISKQARMEVKAGVPDTVADCLHVWPLRNHFLITLKGELQQRGRERISGSLRGSLILYWIKALTVNSCNYLIFPPNWPIFAKLENYIFQRLHSFSSTYYFSPSTHPVPNLIEHFRDFVPPGWCVKYSWICDSFLWPKQKWIIYKQVT